MQLDHISPLNQKFQIESRFLYNGKKMKSLISFIYMLVFLLVTKYTEIGF
jgi:hypothetical protein